MLEPFIQKRGSSDVIFLAARNPAGKMITALDDLKTLPVHADELVTYRKHRGERERESRSAGTKAKSPATYCNESDVLWPNDAVLDITTQHLTFGFEGARDSELHLPDRLRLQATAIVDRHDVGHFVVGITTSGSDGFDPDSPFSIDDTNVGLTYPLSFWPIAGAQGRQRRQG